MLYPGTLEPWLWYPHGYKEPSIGLGMKFYLLQDVHQIKRGRNASESLGGTFKMLLRYPYYNIHNPISFSNNTTAIVDYLQDA